MSTADKPLVGIVMGSKSDWETMQACRDTLKEFGVASDCRVLSAHRTPAAACAFARKGESAPAPITSSLVASSRAR